MSITTRNCGAGSAAGPTDCCRRRQGPTGWRAYQPSSGFVEQLDAINTDDVEPLTSVVGATARMRKDAVNAGDYPERVLANAPGPGDGLLCRSQSG